MIRPPAIASIDNVSLRYGDTLALDGINLEIPAQCMVGLIGPDGVGKSSLMALLTGARKLQQGRVETLGGDMASLLHRQSVCPRIAYMPQGLGKNLYLTLSVFENVDFFGRLFGHRQVERRQRIAELLDSTGLAPFAGRPAGKLSGGMKQKLALCCALIHDPDLLVLDEPTTGVDPLSRAQFWELITRVRGRRAGMSVLVSTAYMDEAERFDWLVAMDAGRVLATGTAAELRAQTSTDSLESAFIKLLPMEKRQGHQTVVIPPRTITAGASEIAIEAQGLTMRFDDFVAVDDVSLRIERGEIFGFLGSNGCGKSTTMKMLTGLLPPSAGEARLFGHVLDANNMATRRRVGYMSQAFSLYGELTVRQNLALHAHLFHMPAARIETRAAEMAERFGLQAAMDTLPDALPLGMRQRLSLAVAVIHDPDLLILDEPTSGVDPVARDGFWELIVDLARRDQVTVFISTHFMNEAERCDRISLMHEGKVLASDTPAALVANSGHATLEQAFIAYLQQTGAMENIHAPTAEAGSFFPTEPISEPSSQRFSLIRLFSISIREAIELRRDPIRASISLLGTLFLMLTFGYGITLDVENLRFAVLDRDQTQLSQNYIMDLSGSRYFIAQVPITDYTELDQRMRNGELSLALEIPPNFARDLQRGESVKIGAWIDGAMPTRGENIRAYVLGMHQTWLQEQLRRHGAKPATTEAMNIETRFRYNPDVKSLPAMVPSIIPLLLMLVPAMLTALSVVREKELGSILNLYVTPMSKLEFLLGKQLPYIAVGMVNFLLLCAMAVWVFGIPHKGDFLLLTLAALLYVAFATGFGLLISVFTRTQIAAIFTTFIASFIPCNRFSGMIDPVASLEGGARFFGEIFPGSYLMTICRGTFSKALGFAELSPYLLPIGLAVIVVVGLSTMLLEKQEH